MNKKTIKNAANQLQENMIIYFDEDTKESGFCSESEFDFLADTNQVEYSWIKEVITPESFPMQQETRRQSELQRFSCRTGNQTT